MKTVIHPASSRGHSSYGWLDANYSFSFANYFNPEKTGFGALLVLNQDVIAPSKGFGTHPHRDMEIVTIVLSGTLEHKDSLGSFGQINAGEVQVMSAGTGVTHSEYNPNPDQEAHTLQIWVLPKEKGIAPRYDQKNFLQTRVQNKFQPVVSFDQRQDSLYLHQDALFEIGDFDQDQSIDIVALSPNHGTYVFVISGRVTYDDHVLQSSDAIGFSRFESVRLRSQRLSQVLAIHVPMYSDQ